MRAIVNMFTPKIAGVAGWQAREIRVDKPVVTVEDVFRSATLRDGTSLYDLIAEPEGIKPDFAMFVDGELLRGAFDWLRPIVDSEQIHVSDWPITGS